MSFLNLKTRLAMLGKCIRATASESYGRKRSRCLDAYWKMLLATSGTDEFVPVRGCGARIVAKRLSDGFASPCLIGSL